MQDYLVSTLIWWLGGLVCLAILTLATAILGTIFTWLTKRTAKSLLHLVRVSTARYWVQRMEREGLMVPQTEYRALVAARAPKTVREFMQLDSVEEARLREAGK